MLQFHVRISVRKEHFRGLIVNHLIIYYRITGYGESEAYCNNKGKSNHSAMPAAYVDWINLPSVSRKASIFIVSE